MQAIDANEHLHTDYPTSPARRGSKSRQYGVASWLL